VTVALLFPGQGTQHDGMLPWLESSPPALAMLVRLGAELGEDWRARLRDDAWAQSNRVAQQLVTAASVAAWATLAPGLPRVVAVAGYSVGEIAACVAAGMLDEHAAFTLATRRADAMDDCAAASDGGLLALSGATAADLADACARWHLEVAIRIGPERCVVGGAPSGLDAASRHLQARGAKATPLGVRVASHTSAMRAAVPALARALDETRWHPPRAPWVAGSRGAVVRDLAQVRQALAEQVAATLRWDDCMDTVAERRPGCVLEVGPGTTLARLWRDRHPRTPVRSCEDFASPAEIRRWVDRAGEG
jgi:[acyl-carrier-protein] S-malonyltransferase